MITIERVYVKASFNGGQPIEEWIDVEIDRDKMSQFEINEEKEMQAREFIREHLDWYMLDEVLCKESGGNFPEPK